MISTPSVKWGDAPDEVVQFLVESYKSIHPNYEFNWTGMVTTLGTAGVPMRIIQHLLNICEEEFPDQLIDWNAVIEKLSVLEVEPKWKQPFQFIVKCTFMERINAIGLKQWRDNVINKVMSPDFIMPYDVEEGTWLDDIRSKLSQYEDDYNKLKEATTLLELALWKIKLNDHFGRERQRQNKRMKIEESDLREQCRVSCESDMVIQHVLPYLLPSSSV